jgi:asparagine synthase (glutamine-hydrolysing)
MISGVAFGREGSWLRRKLVEARPLSHFRKAQFLDFNTYLPDDILVKVDVAGMMNGLEARTPLLDLKVVEFASTIPEELNIAKVGSRWTGKRLLKHLLSSDFGHDFTNRTKMGFGVPLGKWIGGSGVAVKERILDNGSGLDKLFDRKFLTQVVTAGNPGHLWLLLFLQEWLYGLRTRSIPLKETL